MMLETSSSQTRYGMAPTSSWQNIGVCDPNNPPD